MGRVASADGTAIAYDAVGAGPPLVLVAGALTTRRSLAPLAAALAAERTVHAYDRRGRGESGDTPPFAVEREIEDLAAVIGAAGGRAAVYGHSSGAGLALRAAAAGLPIDRLVLHEPPYAGDTLQEQDEAAAFARGLDELIAAGRAEDALVHFLTTAGLPAEALDGMRADPWWAEGVALAPTLAYDSAIMGDAAGGALPADAARGLDLPVLVVWGTASPPFMTAAAERLAALVPGAETAVLDGHGHEAAADVVAGAVAPFLAQPAS